MFDIRTADGAVVGRPRVVLVNCVAWTIVLVGGSLLGWFSLPQHIRDLFTELQVGTLVLFLAFILAFLWTVGLSYVRADASGLHFRNGLRTHHRPWSDVLGFRFAPGDPWAFVQLDDPAGRLALMGVMRTDGARADAIVAALREAQRSFGGGR
ncbi:PH domain-containing protein [Nigerium massiliense]|uniref:PH domain-containing protein n=1 Tax=Nigerium massiliense TaxID=1522317 RepID=UPI00058F9F81|nr:PH domain-containing protein [Nigerium massiliense]